MEISIIESFLPKGLLEHFDITSFKELGNLTTKKDWKKESHQEKYSDEFGDRGIGIFW
jgi:hypothetical protein